MKYISNLINTFKTLFPVFDIIKNIELPQYNFKTHIGLFLLYNVPLFSCLLTVLIFKLFFGGFFDFISHLPEIFQIYFYDGICIIGDTPTWRIHLAANIIIFLFVFFED